ncbi:MAG: DinB family protein [Chloroflexota bacterium]
MVEAVNRVAAVRQQLIDSRAYLDAVLDRVEGRWDEQVYSDGLQWTVRQLVIHLADADKGHNNQVMNIAQGRDIIPEDFDIERYNRRVTEKNAEKSADQARAELVESRAQLMTWLDELDESSLDTQGRHATLRVMTVEQILGVLSNHERDHARDIAQVLQITV